MKTLKTALRLAVCLNTAALAGVCWLFCLNIPTLLSVLASWLLGSIHAADHTGPARHSPGVHPGRAGA
jgi:hypothetical protein